MHYTDKDIIKITSFLPNLLFKDIKDISKKFDLLTDYGYSNQNIIEITRKVPCILEDNHINNLNNQLEFLENFSFTKDEIISITCKNPFIILYSLDYLKWKLDNLLNYFSKDELIKIINDFPIIIGYSIRNIKLTILVF